jgi:hypothetical protein
MGMENLSFKRAGLLDDSTGLVRRGLAGNAAFTPVWVCWLKCMQAQVDTQSRALIRLAGPGTPYYYYYYYYY